MWNSIISTSNEIENKDIKKIINGQNSSIIIRNFYEKEKCEKIIKRISNADIENDSKKFNHIGPFLMNYTTRKGRNIFKMQKKQMLFLTKFFQILKIQLIKLN